MKYALATISLVALTGCSTLEDEPPQDLEAATQDVVETAVIAEEAVVVDDKVVEDAGVADMAYYCAPQEDMTPICGFQSPEDAEWLPDGSGLIISEYGQYVFEGAIKRLDHETGEISLLWNSGMQTAGEGLNEWGADGVTQKEKFSPHGISLSQREDGRWQLMVVNHAEQETIDLFELLEVDGQWTLQWRGGVDADGADFYNDVAATGAGFYTTRFFRDNIETLAVDYAEGRLNGVVKKWTPEQGWMELAGTKGVILNGVLWNEADDELVVNEWGKGRVNVFTGEGEKKYTIEDVSHPDNVSWNEARDGYLVASKKVSVQKLVECGAAKAEVCEGPFSIYEITPESGLKTTRYESDGEFWGPPSNAVERDGKLYLGSFQGSRVLVVE